MKKKAVKKKIKKLQLSRETVRELAGKDVPQVKAAVFYEGISGETVGCSGCA